MNKNYKQELQDLKSGLTSIENIIKNSKDTRQVNKAMHAKEIQEARIDFFKKGYSMCKRELKSQRSLP